MHPLPALQILSSNPEITLGVAKDYIKLTLDARSQAIRQDTERIEQKKAQIEVKRRNIEELRTRSPGQRGVGQRRGRGGEGTATRWVLLSA